MQNIQTQIIIFQISIKSYENYVGHFNKTHSIINLLLEFAHADLAIQLSTNQSFGSEITHIHQKRISTICAS